MADWWEAAPVVKRSGGSGTDNWWDAAPMAEPAVERPATRSWGQALDDTALGIREGVRNVAASTLGLPVNIANFALQNNPGAQVVRAAGYGDRIPTIQQPDAIRGTQAELRAQNVADAERSASERLIGLREGLADQGGFLDTAAFLARNPAALADVGAQQVGQVLNVAPGAGALANIGVGGLSAGGQAANEVAAELATRDDLTPQQRAAREADAFGASAALNTVLPFLPGARVIERGIGGQVAADAAERSLGRAITSGLVAEGITGAASEAGDQIIQNLATDRPWSEGAGQSAAIGTILEGPLGAVAGAGEAVQARRSPTADAWWADAPEIEPTAPQAVTPSAPVVPESVAPAAAPPVADVPAPPAPAVAEAQPVAPAPEAAAAPEAAPDTTAALSPPAEFATYTPGENVIVERSDDVGTYRENRLTRAILDKHVQTGDTSALLTDLAQQPDIAEGERWLAERLAPIMRDLDIRITEPRKGFREGGAWDNTARSLFVRQATPETVLHEALHGATSALIDSSSAQSVPEVRQFVADLQSFGQHLQGTLLDFDTQKLPPAVQRTIADPNGPLANPKELLAYAMTNRGFQYFLRQIPAPPGWQSARTAWDALKQAVVRLFGATTPAQISLLDAVIESGGGLVDFAANNPRAVQMVQRLQQGATSGTVPAGPLTAGRPPAPAEPPVVAAAPTAPTARAEAATAPASARREPSPTSTGTKNAVRDAERAAEGRDPIVRAAAKSNEQTVSEAESAIAANPTLADEIVERLTTQPAAVISSVDEAVLLIEKVRLRKERDSAASRAGDEKLSPEQRAVAQREWAASEAAIDRIDQATSASGREWGRLGQFRQRMMREDFTLEAMERRARAVVGGALSPEMQRTIATQAAKIEALQKQIAESESRVVDAETTRLVSETLDRTIREVTAATKRAAKAGKPRADVLKERADAARERLRKRATEDAVEVAGLDLSALTDPDSISNAVDLGTWHIAQGVSDFADFTAKMKADIGAGFDSLSGRMAEIFARAQQQNQVSEQSYAAGVRTVEQVSGGIDPEAVTTGDVRALVQAHIAAGLRAEAEIMRAVHGDLTKLGATLTERDVRRLFSEYGKATYPSKDEDRKALRELRALVQMQESIDRLTEGLPKLKSGPQRDAATAAIRQKRAQLDELLKLAAAKQPMTPERAEMLRNARVRNLQARIADLQDMLATGRRPAKRGARNVDGETLALEQKRDELVRQLRDLDRPPRDPEAIYQRSRATSMRGQIAELQRRLREDDYSKPVRVPRPLTDENERIAYELDQQKRAYNKALLDHQLSQRGRARRYLDNAVSGVNLARAIMTSFDVSAVLRQGGFITLGAPRRAASSIVPMFQSFASEQRQHAIDNEIAKRPNARLYKLAGLDLTRNDGKLTQMEEAYMSRWIERSEIVPGQTVRNTLRRAKDVPLAFVRGSGRAYTTFLNKLRADSFDAMLAGLSQNATPTTDEIKAIGAYINAATGRGKIGSSEAAAVGLNTVFFAPKLVASRFQLLVGQPLYGGSAATRKLIAQDYARFMAGLSVVYTLGYMLSLAVGDDEDDDRPFIEMDPRSSSFGRVRFGDWFIDPLAGLAQVTTVLSRVATGETKTGAGDVNPLRDGYRISDGLYGAGQILDKSGFDTLASVFPTEPNYDKVPYGGQGVFDTMANFLRTKLAPVPGATVNSLAGENVIGQKTTPGEEAVRLVIPMSMGNIADGMRDLGVPGGLAVTGLEMLGMSVQYRDPASMHAPDYVNMTFDQRKEYSAYRKAVQNVDQGVQELRDIANAFPKDAHPADVRDAVETRAAELGLDGVSVGRYVANSSAKDERGVSKAGRLKRSESGNVEMQYADWSKARAVNNANKQVGALNKQITSLYERQMSYDDLSELAGPDYDTSGFGAGMASLDDRMDVAKALAERRAEIMRAAMEELR